LRNSSRYHHIDYYADTRNEIWKHYEEYVNTVKDLSTDSDILPGVNTQRFVLEKLN
jgi:hypothetical protein